MATALKPAPQVRPDINEYVLRHGRLPFLGESPQPWEYRGWLLWHVQLADYHPNAPGRWRYYMRTMEAGRLLAEPIPHIDFANYGGALVDKGRAELARYVDRIFHEVGSWSAFPLFLDWMQWGLATSNEPPRMSAALNEWLYRNVNLEHWLVEPFDYFGHHYQEGKGRWNPTAFYLTPHNVCEMMARMVFHDVGTERLPDGRDPRTVTVCDPCVGSGIQLLHASNYSFCLYGMDIDATCCAITKINGALYVPWLTFPFPQRILNVSDLPAPPPALLPVPEEYRPERGIPVYRVDDRGQGLLFNPDGSPAHLSRQGDETDESK
jgi:hypothetical protein